MSGRIEFLCLIDGIRFLPSFGMTGHIWVLGEGKVQCHSECNEESQHNILVISMKSIYSIMRSKVPHFSSKESK